MRETVTRQGINTKQFAQNLVQFSTSFEHAVILNSNNYTQDGEWFNGNKGIELLAAFGAVGNTQRSLTTIPSISTNDWLFGYISYDAKNAIESSLSSKNPDRIEFDEVLFFTPQFVLQLFNSSLSISYLPELNNKAEVEEMINNIIKIDAPNKVDLDSYKINHSVTQQDYLTRVEEIKEHIHRGDIYELNYCVEFFSEQRAINPVTTYNKLTNISPTPFAAFLKTGERYLLSASPERYIKRIGNKILSQPIKGTAKRGSTNESDTELKTKLQNDPKEQSENIMITDLVRNDLAKVALRGSVKVEELMGVYTFPQVHQLISTISALVETETSWLDIVKATFPMGSMTGAPKISAMHLIEQYEVTKRGLYSGAVGYIAPNGDFDFNVVIRSLLYNNATKTLSFSVGSAITASSNADQEYKECLLKASALLKALNAEL